ncbi:helix-turn-helix domain-containing protein [Bdellovibrio sp. HCB-162]|uniref:helix-turn-helix domain-containing protein n=1 Tax=Bdellovibrio sp. HCB-162 TaxID=3394234 RepID=UPI0039BCE816
MSRKSVRHTVEKVSRGLPELNTCITINENRGSSALSKLFENRIWKIGQVAEYTGYSIGTLYNLTSQDLIPHRKKRGKLFFKPLEIENWFEEGDI